MSGNLTPYHTYNEGNALPTVNPTGTHSNEGQLGMSSKLVGGKRKRSRRGTMKKSAKRKCKLGKRKSSKRKTYRKK
jgi:hypothetical protein